MQITAYLGLGSNVGQCVQTLKNALRRIDQHPSIKVKQSSSIYKTNPVGYLDQPDFYNLVVEVQTNLLPKELLGFLLQVEKEFHRVRAVRWGPRTIDIDILLYGEEIIHQSQLRIPHPRMSERGFVLIPLYEIAGDVRIPGVMKSCKRLVEQLPVDQRVERWMD